MSGTALKLIAFFLMIIDHIWQFVGAPTIFNMLGRLSAPIFMFLVIEGYTKTHSKEKYIAKLYLFSVIMGFLDCFINMNLLAPQKPPVFNNIFAMFFIVCSIIYTFDKTVGVKKMWITLFVYFQPIFILIALFMYVEPANGIFTTAILPSVAFAEGGVVFVCICLAMYVLRNEPVKRDIAYILLSLTYFPFRELMISGVEAFTQRYQWLMVFSVIFFHLYNGERGNGYKYFFYIGYPLHILLLNLI